MTGHQPGNFTQCRCNKCRKLRLEIPKEQEKDAVLVQQASVPNLGQLYRRAKAAGLTLKTSAYN